MLGGAKWERQTYRGSTRIERIWEQAEGGPSALLRLMEFYGALFPADSRCTGDRRPLLDRTPVAGLPVSVFGVQRKAGFDDEVHGGLVVKGDINVVEAIRGKEFNVVDGLAFGFFKAVEA